MYIEGNVPYVTNGYNNNSNGWGFGGDGIWALALLALLGFGNGYGGFGFGRGGSGSEALGYELGKVATTNDVASGFSTSAIMSDLNSIKENQLQQINFNNQGFAGINTQIMNSANGINNAICTLGYQNQMGFNGVSREIADCCCKTQNILLENRYLNEKQTCDILRGQADQTQAILNYLTTEKIDTLNRKLATTEAAYSQCQNNAYLLGQIRPNPIPAYPVFPTTSFAYPSGVAFGVGQNFNPCC